MVCKNRRGENKACRFDVGKKPTPQRYIGTYNIISNRRRARFVSNLISSHMRKRDDDDWALIRTHDVCLHAREGTRVTARGGAVLSRPQTRYRIRLFSTHNIIIHTHTQCIFFSSFYRALYYIHIVTRIAYGWYINVLCAHNRCTCVIASARTCLDRRGRVRTADRETEREKDREREKVTIILLW